MSRLLQTSVIVAVLMFITPTSGAGVDNSYCTELADYEGVAEAEFPQDGLVLYYVPYLWCKSNCSGWTAFPKQSFVLLLFQFILPAIIFSTVIPRRWHFDLPEQLFNFQGNWFTTIAQTCFTFIAVGVTASIDMISWITGIMTLAGPMLFSGIQEMLLDYRVVKYMRRNLGGTARDRLEIVTSLLCGNFDFDPGDPKPRIKDILMPANLAHPQNNVAQSALNITKSRMASIMNAQTSFGAAIGIPTIFFLGGFLYNALGITTDTAIGSNWVPFAVLWMLLVNVAVVSGTLLAGNNPSVVSVLVATDQVPIPQSKYKLLRDYYESELYPVSMWNRGISKYRWLQTTAMWRNNSTSFMEDIALGSWAWTIITLTASILILIPCLLAYFMAYYLPFARQGCRTLSYGIYLGCQLFLTLITAALQSQGISFSDFFNPHQSTALRVSLWGRLPFLRIMVLLLLSIAIGLSAFITFAGTIFQFFGVYDNCFCQTSVPTWVWPAGQRSTFLDFTIDEIYKAYLRHLATSMTWIAAVFTGFLCYFGWWYQRVLRTAVKEIIEEIHL